MNVAVIILNYNSAKDCEKCISFLQKQQKVVLEIIVVDNCSQYDDIQRLRKLCTEQNCTLIESCENRGYNSGNNIGIRYAVSKGYKYALIANPDMEFPQVDYINRLFDCMILYSNTVIVGSDIVTPNGIHQNPMREMTFNEEFWWWVTFMRTRNKHPWFGGDYTQSGLCEKLSGCCFLVNLSFIKQIGYFDENVFLYSEEPILAKQVQKAGCKMYYCAEAQAIHRHIKSEKGNPRKRMQLLFSSREYYLRNYSGYHGLKLCLLLISKRLQKLLYSICG